MGESLLILIVGVGKNMGQPADLTKGVVGCSPRVGIPGSNLEKKKSFQEIRIINLFVNRF